MPPLRVVRRRVVRRRVVVLRGDFDAAVERLAAGFRAVEARLEPELDFARDAVDLRAVDFRAVDFRAVDFLAVDFRPPPRVERRRRLVEQQ